MRNLTIKRERSSAARFTSDLVYVEDHLVPDLEIQGVPCRRLGRLPNGGTLTKPISSRAIRLFVVPGWLHRDRPCQALTLEPGEEDVFLSGCRTRQEDGKARFCFDGVPVPGLPPRRMAAILLLALLAASVLLGFFLYCAQEPPVLPRIFRTGSLSITLDNRFRAEEREDFTAYLSDRAGIYVLEGPSAGIPQLQDMSRDDYAQLTMLTNGLSGLPVEHRGQLTYYQYSQRASASGRVYHYYIFVFKSGGQFWLVQCFAPERTAAQVEPEILSWAGSVRFQ